MRCCLSECSLRTDEVKRGDNGPEERERASEGEMMPDKFSRNHKLPDHIKLARQTYVAVELNKSKSCARRK